jgi:hypothetical protein
MINRWGGVGATGTATDGFSDMDGNMDIDWDVVHSPVH